MHRPGTKKPRPEGAGLAGPARASFFRFNELPPIRGGGTEAPFGNGTAKVTLFAGFPNFFHTFFLRFQHFFRKTHARTNFQTTTQHYDTTTTQHNTTQHGRHGTRPATRRHRTERHAITDGERMSVPAKTSKKDISDIFSPHIP